jgi:hypothetical protein
MASNVSNLIPPEINLTVNSIQKPKSFGDQVKNYAKQKVIQGALGIVDQLKNEIEDVIQKKIDLEVNHTEKLLDLNKKHQPSTFYQYGKAIEGPALLTDEEYNKAVALENANYEQSKKDLQKNQDDLNKRLLKILTDPYTNAKNKLTKLKGKLQQRKKRSKAEKDAARTNRIKALKSFAKKDLVPVLTLILTEALVKIISQSGRLQNLVDQTNATIENANTEEKIQQAIILRDNTLKAINDVEKSLVNISQQISKYQLYITIFDAIITLILSIPIPTSVPPGIGIPVNLIIKLQNILMKAEKIVTGLSSVLSAVAPIIESAIFELENLKLELENINGLIDDKTTNTLSSDQLSSLLNLIRPSSLTNQFEDYKGFKFSIKEEQNSQFVVEGNKRHYAVAIDHYGVEAIRSGYSFTQDPQVLVDQLKIVIDQKNLQG